jgi:hypothetical protein
MNRFTGWRFWGLALGVALAVPAPATAQRFRTEPAPRYLEAGDPGVPNLDLVAARRQARLRLFANGDLAAAGSHGVGNFGTYVSNVGPCDDQFLFGVCHIAIGTAYAGGAATFQFFEIPFIAGVPASEWTKALAVAPSLANATGGGFVVHQNFALFAGRLEFGPADGTLGSLFAGVTSTDDGGCRDNTSFFNGFMSTGIQLLAHSNCPETWASGGFNFRYRFPEESWTARYAAEGSAFRFDFHRLTRAEADTTKMLAAFQTYGRVSDHYREILAAYGNVVPGGSGAPGIGGWPLGLDVDFRAFSFTTPAVASAMFMEVFLINRSEDVYGVGLNYDSLYFGLMPGTGGSTGGGGQRFSNYYLADFNAGVYHQSGVNPTTCAQSSRFRPDLGCATTLASRGYGNAGNVIVWLKSPYGDARNKLFTRVGSAFYDPSHPAAGDTILFNHGHMCGFGGCWANTHNVNDRRAFGVLSSTEANELDGRAAATLSATEAWRVYRNREHPGVLGVFNRWVPGGFDYNKDGVQDTLFYDSCGGRLAADMALGCVGLDSDTLPGGQLNSYGNVGGIAATGPFSLAAGDTAVFIWAFIGDRSPPASYATMGAVINHYLNFYLAPEPPPVVNITTTQSEPPSSGQPTVTLFFSDTAETFRDPFLDKFAANMAAASPPSELYRLAQLNPNLIADIQDRAGDNLDTLFIFKSCDGGATFTDDGDCNGDEAVDAAGNAVGLGWQAYAIFERKPGEDLPNTFTDGSVQGGRNYLYVLIGKSRGATFLVRDSLDTDGNGTFDVVGGRELEIAPALFNPLSRSVTDPNVVSVYVPGSRQAGSSVSSASVTATGPATVPFGVSLTDASVPGNYSAVFGNRLTIIEYRTGNTLDSTFVLVEDTVVTAAGGAVIASVVDTLRGATVSYAGTPVVTVVGDTTTYRFAALGFGLFGPTSPVFVSTVLTGDPATPPSLFGRPEFPGFIVSADNRNAGLFVEEATIEPDGDTVDQGIVNSFMVQWRNERATAGAGYAGGRYLVNWLSDPFGLTNGIVLNLTDPTATQAELQAALSSRPTGTVAQNDAATAALVGVAASDLVQARMPFTITNTVTGRRVGVAMRARPTSTVLLGSGFDTIRVDVQATEWVPGDSLFLIDTLTVDSTVAGNVVLGGGGLPIPVPAPRVAFTRAILGCNTPRETCNPARINTPGQSGYVSLASGTQTHFHYGVGFNRDSRYDFTVTGPVTGTGITSVPRAQLDSIRVVPNPFVVFSQYQSEGEGGIAESRVLFTHLPPRGTIRVYSVSGQFLQQITYDEADLNGFGDLFYNLRTREGTDLASGLYIWVLTTNVGGTTQRARGKFVVIRGQNN